MIFNLILPLCLNRSPDSPFCVHEKVVSVCIKLFERSVLANVFACYLGVCTFSPFVEGSLRYLEFSARKHPDHHNFFHSPAEFLWDHLTLYQLKTRYYLEKLVGSYCCPFLVVAGRGVSLQNLFSSCSKMFLKGKTKLKISDWGNEFWSMKY